MSYFTKLSRRRYFGIVVAAGCCFGVGTATAGSIHTFGVTSIGPAPDTHHRQFGLWRGR